MSSLCTKIMRVCEKSTYITFVNHCWIVGSSWRQYLNQLFEIISALNINDWHARGLCLPQTTNDMNCMTLDKNLHHDQAFANSSTISLHSNIIHLNGVETQKTKNSWHSPGWPGSAVLPENSWGKKRLKNDEGNKRGFTQWTWNVRSLLYRTKIDAFPAKVVCANFSRMKSDTGTMYVSQLYPDPCNSFLMGRWFNAWTEASG